jgi:hypothetical protein
MQSTRPTIASSRFQIQAKYGKVSFVTDVVFMDLQESDIAASTAQTLTIAENALRIMRKDLVFTSLRITHSSISRLLQQRFVDIILTI